VSEEKSTILVVEDDVDVAEMLSAYFRGQDYEVLSVNWGEDAIQACRTSRPDLVILDIRLPDIDGFEVARRLRTNQRTKEIPLIFLTEKRDRSDLLQGLEAGADDYITKPFDIQELRLRVRNSLRRTEQSTLTNPVTGLPEGALVDERLLECLNEEDWALLQVSIENLSAFRDAYGFVASDDVLRAISLMIHNAIRSVGGSNDFLGQVGPTDFILVTSLQSLPALVDRIGSRLRQSLDYFYPLKDRDKKDMKERLAVKLIDLAPEGGAFETVEEIKSELSLRRNI
jgi:DNA-binding response OmpR family regulator